MVLCEPLYLRVLVAENVAADATMCPSLSVEVSALGAPIIHLASEKVGEQRAQHQDCPEHCDGQQGIGQAFHVLPMADLPLVVSL